MCLRDLIFFIAMVIIAIAGLGLIMPVRREMNEKKVLLRELQLQNEALEKELAELKKENSELQNENPYTLQRAARETYDFCYPGERIYRFPKHK